MFNKYREIGLSLIPIRPNSKAPSLDGWPEFCDRLPSESECDEWESRGLESRVGLCLGQSGGVMAIDIDSDDAKILNAVKPSPVRKRGKKGETRFFRFDPNVPSCKVAGCIDVLAHGRQTVMPPTTHPETGQPYVWLTPDTLEGYPAQDLPLFTPDDLSDLRRALEPEKWEAGDESGISLTGGPWFNNDPKRLCPHGSHDRLKRIANAVIARGASPDEAVRELLRYDDENHKPVGYFSDQTRADCFADPASNALYFYASNLRTFNRRQVRSGHGSVIPLISGTEILDISGLSAAPSPQNVFKPQDLPWPKGLMGDVADLILSGSKRRQPVIALSAAVSICSVLLANRYRYKKTWPNLMAMLVAPTGTGKSFADEAAKLILEIETDTGLLGYGDYLSSQAFLKKIDSKRERLDVIDECSRLFQRMNVGGAFQQDILDIMMSVYSSSHSLFLVPEAKGTDSPKVFHPCVSALMMTNQDGFLTSVTKHYVTKGFLPRCLMFVDWGYGDLNEAVEWSPKILEKIKWKVSEVMAMPIEYDPPGSKEKRNIMCPRPYPREVMASGAAQKLLREYDLEKSNAIADEETPEMMKHFLTRSGQQVEKLALIHGVLTHGMIEESDVRWAISFTDALLSNAMPLINRVSASTPSEAAIVGILEIIRGAGTISVAKLFECTRHLTKQQRNDALDALTQEGKIRLVSDNGTKTYISL